MATRLFERRSGRWLLVPAAITLLATFPGHGAATAEAAAPAVAEPPAVASLPAVAAPAAASPATRAEAGESGAPAPEEVVAPDSPRASLADFLDLCRAGRYRDAARYLDLPPADAGRGPALARRLKAVLDRHAWIDLGQISPESHGSADDNLPPDTDEIAFIPGPAGGGRPVRLERREEGEETLWVFSRATVGRIDGWYDRLENLWAFENLPAPLLLPGPGNLLWWQWLALPLMAIVAWGAGRLLSRITRAVLRRVTARTRTTWDDVIVTRIGGPLSLAWALVVFSFLLSSIALYRPAERLLDHALRAVLFLALFWAVLRSVEIVGQLIARTPWAADHPASRSLVPLGARVAKVMILAVAVTVVLSELGFPVASLVAGLGIGGLALALAAQKTVENLFGSFSIGVDQPFRQGDFVRIEDFVGTVESIGLRSTRFRTLDRTLISIPNGKLAEMRLESFSARDRMRLACTLGLVYGTTAAQMREVLSGLERVLRAHPRIWPDAMVVRFKEFASSSLDIEIMAWFRTPEWSEFQQFRQEVLLQFMEVVEKAGTAFAFPSRTVHLVTEKN